MQLGFLAQKDPLEEGMPTHSSTLAWRITQTEAPHGLWSIGLQSQTRLKRLSTHTHTHTHTHARASKVVDLGDFDMKRKSGQI